MNSFQQPNDNEPGGATWHKVYNPATGWIANKTSSWVSDRFSSTPTDCLTVDFSSVVPVGTKAVLVTVDEATADGYVFARPGGDTNYSNTPYASAEWSALICRARGSYRVMLWLSSTYTVDLAVTDTAVDLYVSYPVGYLL